MPTNDEMKGRADENVGDLNDNDQLEREGKADQASGKVEDLVEDVKEKVNDAIDAFEAKAHRS